MPSWTFIFGLLKLDFVIQNKFGDGVIDLVGRRTDIYSDLFVMTVLS